ncbi:ATPase [Mycolicibacterium celeriflavum]|nr:ATPase [Mycolicibacterium celeriflavum]
MRRPVNVSECHVRRGLHRADGGGLRRPRLGPEVGRAPVSYGNAVGLVLAILVAVFLFAALLFPERF